jgi:hypothetical protein
MTRRAEIEALVAKLEAATPEERWRPIAGWPNYLVSDLGRVHGPKGILNGEITGKGYRRVLLSNNGVHRKAVVHRLVVEAFIGPIEPGFVPNHRDGVKLNNALVNLEVVTHQGNVLHAVKNGLAALGDRNGARTQPHRLARGERNGSSKLTAEQVLEIRCRRANGDLLTAIATTYGVDQSLISHICRGKGWTHV